MTAILPYETGTVSVAADGTIVTGVGTIWSGTNAKPGDQFSIGHFSALIVDVVDVTHLKITPWPGSTLSGANYSIWPNYPMRVAGAQAMQTVNDLVAAFNTSGFFVFVDVALTAPDPSLGDDGQYAFQPTTGKTWAKVAGVWTFLGIYKAFQLKGAWSGATAYAAGDVVTLSGSSYVCVLDHTNHTPPNATYWQLLASIGATGNTGPAGAGYGGTSTTSLAIGTGSKAFTTQAGLAYTNGARVRASSAANTSNWMEGLVTYSGTTLTMTSDKTNGSGTLADWNFNVVGQPGAGDLSSANNLSDVANKDTAINNLHGINYNAAQSLTGAQQLQAQRNAGIPVTLRGYIDGLKMSTPGASTTLTVGAGVAVDDTGADTIIMPSSFNKVTSAWAATTNGGGLDTGTIAPNTWYHYFVIKNPTTAAVDALISLSPTSPTMPSGYTLKRRVGSAKTNGLSQWIKFIHLGDKFLWDVPTQDDTSVVGTTAVLITLNVPTGVQVDAEIYGIGVNASTGICWLITSPDQADSTPSTSLFSGITTASVNIVYSQVVRTDTSGRVRKRANAASTTVYINTYGWTDRRGRDA